jgi:hypothetical protein
MKSRYLNCCLSAVLCLLLLACIEQPQFQITCGFTPNSNVVIEGGGADGSDIYGYADANGCVRHRRGAIPRHIPIHE